MSSITDLIRPELYELPVLEKLEKLLYLTLLQSSICKYRSFSTKLGDNIFDQQILDKCNYGYYQSYSELFVLELEKLC